jgi:hypothetical protein
MKIEAACPAECYISEDINFCFLQILQSVWEDSMTYAKFEVLTVVMLKIQVFSDVNCVDW